MATLRYPVIMTCKDLSSHCSASVPDLNMETDGKNLKEAYVNVKQSINQYVQERPKDDVPTPHTEVKCLKKDQVKIFIDVNL